jgi:hypothetical protein
MDTELRSLEREFLMSPNQEMLSRLGSALGRAGDVTLASWLQFLGGHWTMNPPTKEGSYYTKTLQHELNMLIHVNNIHGQLVVSSNSWIAQSPSERWGAYWWSESMPNMPVHTTQDQEK